MLWKCCTQYASKFGKLSSGHRTRKVHFSLSCIGEGNGNPLQCSCLENPRDGEGWWAAVYGVTQSWTQLSDLTFTSVWDECNCAVVWVFFGIAFGIGMKTDVFQSCGHCWVFHICWPIECSTFAASSFRIWNSSAGIPSPPPALFVVMPSKAYLTSHSGMSGF